MITGRIVALMASTTAATAALLLTGAGVAGASTLRAAHAGAAACTSSHLRSTLAPAPGGGAAGSTYEVLVLTNTGPSSCSVRGFPGVSYVAGRDGHQVGAPADRDRSAAVRTVVVAPRAAASATLRVVQYRNYDTATCRPVTVRGLRVYPPNRRAALFAPSPGTACSSARVHLLTVGPLRAGTAG